MQRVRNMAELGAYRAAQGRSPRRRRPSEGRAIAIALVVAALIIAGTAIGLHLRAEYQARQAVEELQRVLENDQQDAQHEIWKAEQLYPEARRDVDKVFEDLGIQGGLKGFIQGLEQDRRENELSPAERRALVEERERMRKRPPKRPRRY